MALIWLLVVVPYLLAGVVAGRGTKQPKEDTHFPLALDWAMNWGEWGPQAFCPQGTYAYAFELKVESEAAIDDTSMNGIMLYCRAPQDVGHDGVKPKVGTLEFTVTSTVQKWGDWQGKRECPEGFLTGVMMKSEAKQGILDDTAANDLEMQCNWSDFTINGGGNPWGTWSSYTTCPQGWAICGIETKVAAASAMDDTALNNVIMYCCDAAASLNS
ncbi:vitelline membrane outer layer protein 1-like isoform X1 [Cherax quadricarinatus]